MIAIYFCTPMLAALKKEAAAQFPSIKSSHLSEALARAAGFNTHAALLSVANLQVNDADYRPLDLQLLRARLGEFGYIDFGDTHVAIFDEAEFSRRVNAAAGEPSIGRKTLNSLAELGLPKALYPASSDAVGVKLGHTGFPFPAYLTNTSLNDLAVALGLSAQKMPLTEPQSRLSRANKPASPAAATLSFTPQYHRQIEDGEHAGVWTPLFPMVPTRRGSINPNTGIGYWSAVAQERAQIEAQGFQAIRFQEAGQYPFQPAEINAADVDSVLTNPNTREFFKLSAVDGGQTIEAADSAVPSVSSIVSFRAEFREDVEHLKSEIAKSWPRTWTAGGAWHSAAWYTNFIIRDYDEFEYVDVEIELHALMTIQRLHEAMRQVQDGQVMSETLRAVPLKNNPLHHSFARAKHFSLEDPVERRIGETAHFNIGRVTESTVAKEDPYTDWRVDGLLATLGPVVAFEREGGGMALSTWDGDDTTVWAKFDTSPLPPLVYMRKHMVAAVGIDQPRPDGFIRVICFTR